jgi:hypothetical protein
MTKEMHLLRHYFFPITEGDVVVASKQRFFLLLKSCKVGLKIGTKSIELGCKH